MSTVAAVIGRILISLVFIVSGINALTDLSWADTMVTAVGLPRSVTEPAAIFEIVAGLCLAFGFLTRIAAFLLAIFTALIVIFFHNRFNDPRIGLMALEEIAVIGGLFLVFAHSQMWWSWDRMRAERRGLLAGNRADERAHAAELRAARAEGAAGALRPAPAGAAVADEDDVVPVRRRRWGLF
jgi:putative oxidoreductase